MANTMDRLRSAAHDAISRALDEGNIKNPTHRGMCIEVGLEAFDDAILHDSEAPVPVAATLDDAAADPALTLDVARELLRDAAAGIRQLAASAERTEPAEGREAVMEIIGWANDATPRLRIYAKLHNLPAGTKLYTTPPAGDGANRKVLTEDSR